MSVPPVDKIDKVPNDVWDVLFQNFLSPELLHRLDTPVMDEGAIEEFEKWSDDENEVVSSTSNREDAALVPVTLTRFRTVTNDQLETAVKKRIPKGMQKSINRQVSMGVLPFIREKLPVQHSCLKKILNS